MAEKTVGSADLDAAGKAAALAGKLGAIEEMRKAATSRDVWFRGAIVQYFGEAVSPRRRSLAVRIVDLLFSQSHRIRRTPLGCDTCDRVRVDGVVGWALQVFGPAR